MDRGTTGRYETTVFGGERVRAFVPSPLPPQPKLDLLALQEPLEAALLSLGRLDSVSTLLPDPGLFIYSYVRKEAVLSSQIEGTQSSLSDLLLFEIEGQPGVPVDDVTEVSRYVEALYHGIQRLHDDFPVVQSPYTRDAWAAFGRRTGQRHVAGGVPGIAELDRRARGLATPITCPRLLTLVQECMSGLEGFLHSSDSGVPAVIRAGLAHAQFETIHPFLDGNGRVGRLLITMLLYHSGILREPLLYLSLYLKQHRQRYYELLDGVRLHGDWEAWTSFFLGRG